MNDARTVIRRMFNEAAIKGQPRKVRLRSLYAWEPKIIATLAELKQGEVSYHSAGSPLLVSKLSRRGAWYVMDGHHRAIEAIQRGDSTIDIAQSADVPNIEHGGGYRNMLAKMVNLVYFVEANVSEAEQAPRPQDFFHVSRTVDEPAILAQGLEPRLGPRAGTHEPEPRVYLFPSMDEVEHALMNWLGEEVPEDESVTVYKVSLPPEFPVEPTFEGEVSWEWSTIQHIPPEYVSVDHRE